MRDRDRGMDHEAAWARELDTPQEPHIERLVENAEARLRAKGASVAELRSDWAELARQEPVEDDVVLSNFARARHIAYARVVGDLLRQDVDARHTAAPSRDELPSRETAADCRPSDVPPEDWYLERVRVLDARSRASVDREVDRLKDLPQLSTSKAAGNAMLRVAKDFERGGVAGVDNGKLRTRLYALAVVCDLRKRDQVGLLRVRRIRLDEIREMSPQRAKAFAADAVAFLRSSTAADDHQLSQILLDEQTDDESRLAAVALSAPSVAELEGEAKSRDVTFHTRVERQVRERMFSPQDDGELRDALAERRLRVALAEDAIESVRAYEEAVELAETIRRLALARSRELGAPSSGGPDDA